MCGPDDNQWGGRHIPVPDVFQVVSANITTNTLNQFNYQSIGSGGAFARWTAGTVDFGATDGPMSDDQLASAKTKILHVPTVLGSESRRTTCRG